MKCYNCGHLLPEDSEFCQYCGKKIETEMSIQEKAVVEEVVVSDKTTETEEIDLPDLENTTTEEALNAIIKIQTEETFKKVKESKKSKNRFCKFCGAQIDAQTKKCSGCGKQYFKRGKRHKNLFAMIVTVIMLLVSLGVNVIQYQEIKRVNERKEYWHTRTTEVLNEFNTYKSYGKSDPNAVQKLRDKVATSKAIEKSKLKITDKEKATIINYDNPKIENMIFDTQPNIYYFAEGNIIGKSAYKITFNTTQDGLLGPIVYYVEKLSGQLVGMEFRE